jgi:hypothetical protein
MDLIHGKSSPRKRGSIATPVDSGLRGDDLLECRVGPLHNYRRRLTRTHGAVRSALRRRRWPGLESHSHIFSEAINGNHGQTAVAFWRPTCSLCCFHRHFLFRWAPLSSPNRRRTLPPVRLRCSASWRRLQNRVVYRHGARSVVDTCAAIDFSRFLRGNVWVCQTRAVSDQATMSPSRPNPPFAGPIAANRATVRRAQHVLLLASRGARCAPYPNPSWSR